MVQVVGWQESNGCPLPVSRCVGAGLPQFYYIKKTELSK